MDTAGAPHKRVDDASRLAVSCPRVNRIQSTTCHAWNPLSRNGGAGSAEYRFPTESKLKPYAFGGPGLFYRSVTAV
jgi:hypothetical protein